MSQEHQRLQCIQTVQKKPAMKLIKNFPISDSLLAQLMDKFILCQARVNFIKQMVQFCFRESDLAAQEWIYTFCASKHNALSLSIYFDLTKCTQRWEIHFSEKQIVLSFWKPEAVVLQKLPLLLCYSSNLRFRNLATSHLKRLEI